MAERIGAKFKVSIDQTKSSEAYFVLSLVKKAV